jgi:RNA polymerase sigma factor (sigma-70 family)
MNRSACSSSAGSRQRRDEEPLGASGRPRTVTDPTPTAPLARFDALFTEFQRPVLAYAMRRTATLADAEDATAETFTIAWRKLESIPPDAPLPWLYAVARRVLANQRRGGGRRDRLIALLTPNDDVPTPIRLGDDTDGPAFVALATLSPADQEILRLVAWEELGNQAIAQVLGITPNAAAIRLHRARARYAAALSRTPGGESRNSGRGGSPKDPGGDLKYPDATRTSTDVKGSHSAAWKGVAR